MNFEFDAVCERRRRMTIELPHVRAAGSGRSPLEQAFYSLFITLQVKLDGAVTTIAHPPGDTAPRRFTTERVAKTDALDMTDDGAVDGANRHAARAQRHAP